VLYKVKLLLNPDYLRALPGNSGDPLRTALPKEPRPASAVLFLFLRPFMKAPLSTLPKKQNPEAKLRGSLLPNLDSNQDRKIQNLLYYHYTIGQWVGKGKRFCRNYTKNLH
jgi:hypothetical protein